MPGPPDVPAAHVSATARLFAKPGLTCDEVVVGLATAIGGACGGALWERLDDVARSLFGLCNRPLEDQADGLLAAVSEGLAVYRCDMPDDGTMLLDHALSGEPAHALLLAALGHELARRSGLRSAVARSPRGWWTALIGDEAFLPVGYGQTPMGIAAEFSGCCAHQVADAMLERLGRERGSAPTAQARRVEVLRASLMCGDDEV